MELSKQETKCLKASLGINTEHQYREWVSELRTHILDCTTIARLKERNTDGAVFSVYNMRLKMRINIFVPLKYDPWLDTIDIADVIDSDGCLISIDERIVDAE